MNNRFCTILFLSVLLVSCSSSNNSDTPRLGYLLNLTHLVPIYLLEKEEANSAKFKSKYFSSGGYLVNALLTNNLDLVYIGPGPYLNAKIKKVPLRLLRVSCYGANALILNRQADLRGNSFHIKRIAVPQLGNTQDLIAKILVRRLKENKTQLNIRFDDNLVYIAINPAEIEAAFHKGSVDAALVAEPWGTLLETKGGFEFYQNSAIDFINQYPTTLAVVREDYYQKHKSAIDDFIQKQDQIFGDLKNNPELSLQAFQKHMKIIAHKDLKMDFLRTSYSRINFDSKLDEKLLLELEQELYRAKYIRF